MTIKVDAYLYFVVLDGEFGAYMQVSLQNDGPVTFEIESPLNIATKEAKTRSRGDVQNPQNESNRHVEEKIPE